MSESTQITISKSGIPVFAIVILAAIFAFGLFVVGYDQGHIFSVIQGAEAFDELYNVCF